MFRKLLIIDIDVSKPLLVFVACLNLLLFLVLGYREVNLSGFIGATTVSYWVFLIITASIGGDEKRARLLSQLPVTATQIFFSSWVYVLGCLSVNVLFWIIYGFVFDEYFSAAQIPGLFTLALGIAVLSSLISIAIDLKHFRPRYVQFIYILLLVGLLTMSIQFDLSLGLSTTNDGFNIYPFALIDSGPLEMAALLVTMSGLLTVNHFVYTRSDNFLF